MRNTDRIRVIPEAENLAVATYHATSEFPAAERFGLTAQMRRAAVSIGSNVVEGSQRQGNRALLAFLHQAAGSAAELQFQLRIARRLGFGSLEQLHALDRDVERVKRMLLKFIVSLRGKGD